MLDFVVLKECVDKKGNITVKPDFKIIKSKDLMIRGRDFYAVWDSASGKWSTDESTVISLVDSEVYKKVNELKSLGNESVSGAYMSVSSDGIIDLWHRYCQKQMRDGYKELDKDIQFANSEKKRTNYSTKCVPYDLQDCDISGYNRLMDVLYGPVERKKLDWAIGAILSGDAKNIQKFVVLYGAPGSGKSTVLHIIESLFDGYWSTFDAKSLVSGSSFALESLKANPLVAIQHDGDLSKIEDNTLLNSIVSHEQLSVNVKFQSIYQMTFNPMLFIGTNKPVQITDSKSGVLRRLIDVTPTGDTFDRKEYRSIVDKIKFEIPGIALYCKNFYEENKSLYDDYIPRNMIMASNDFYNFIVDNYTELDCAITRKHAYEIYRRWAEDSGVKNPISSRVFGEELKSYYEKYYERYFAPDGSRPRNVYVGLSLHKNKVISNEHDDSGWIELSAQHSLYNDICADCLAQEATENEVPSKKWSNVKTTLKDINTSVVHYVKPPENHVVIDFDIKDANGSKSLDLNIMAANKWPKTYCEVSKSGKAIHLHYLYNGDVSTLKTLYSDEIEIKTFKGGSSLRRKDIMCMNNDMAELPVGTLPLSQQKRGEKFEVRTEKELRSVVEKTLNREYEGIPSTKSSMDFLDMIFKEAYASDFSYDLSSYRPSISSFAASSTNKSEYCLNLAQSLKLKSKDRELASINKDNANDLITFYDVEVFKNLFNISYLTISNKELHDMYKKLKSYAKLRDALLPRISSLLEPTIEEVETFLKAPKLVGFNNKSYDNHIVWARKLGMIDEQLYELSQDIINGRKSRIQGAAYNISYTDIYDYSSKKQSLKKWEIELAKQENEDIHSELGLEWDAPVPDDMRDKVVSYCCDDVAATACVWIATDADFIAREVQVALAQKLHPGIRASVNDSTNSLSAKIIFGNNQNSQYQFCWRDLSKPVHSSEYNDYVYGKKYGENYKFRVFDEKGLPLYRDYVPGEELPKGWSILPFFPEYKFDNGASTYSGRLIGEGGLVIANPGMYLNVWDGDITSMHPHSAISEKIFGAEYTKVFEDLVNARVFIKHKDFDSLSKLFGGVFMEFIDENDPKSLKMLSFALKIIINSIYGLTSAKYMNAFKDPNNIDNIVAKRGNLFMNLLMGEVEKLGYTVCHIKTDSIKIVEADDKIREFVINFGKEYGYSFETEADFQRYCLVNKAVYIALDQNNEWISVGAQFAEPYVYKTMFTHEPITLSDLKIAKSVSKGHIALVEEDGTEHFIGKVGEFVPVVKNGMDLCRIDGEKKYSVSGAKGIKWTESINVKDISQIDMRYFDNLRDEAVAQIKQFGDYESFVS